MSRHAFRARVLWSRPPQHPPMAVQLIMSKADLLKNISRLPIAERLYRSLKDRAKATGDDSGLSEANNELAWILTRRGNLTEAMDLARQAEQFYRKNKDQHALAVTMNNIAAIYGNQSDHESAMSAYREALGLYVLLGDRIESTKVLSNIGVIHFERGEYSKARDHFSKYLTLCQEIRERQHLCVGHYNIARDIGQVELLGRTYSLLGIIYTKRGEFAKAETELREAIALCRRISDKRGLADAINAMGDLRATQEKFDEAERLLRDAERVGRDIGSRHQVCYILMRLANVYRRRGDADQAIAALDEAVGLARENQDAMLADLLRERGEVQAKCGKRNDAVPSLEEAAEIARKTNDMELYTGVRHLLAEIRNTGRHSPGVARSK